MRLKSACGSLLVLLIYSGMLHAASTMLGPTDAMRCYKESSFPLSGQGTSYCTDAISRGELTRRDLAATYSNRGIIYMKNGKFEKALKDHNKAVEIKPDLPQVHINRGNLLYHTHDYEEALVDYDKALENAKGLGAVTLYNKALVLLRMRRISEAKAALEKALEINPQSNRVISKLKDIATLDEAP
jgi:tetratricopeptide (TPR) repeat protein|tara:strand:- start:1174 stop:1731 length:558 start_codon:yes stop_codon:yes gene_type:complete